MPGRRAGSASWASGVPPPGKPPRRAPNSTCVPFSTSATKRTCGKALSPRLAPGRSNAARLSSVSATSRQDPSRLTRRHRRYQAPLVARVATGRTTRSYNRRSGASPRRARACENAALARDPDRLGTPEPAHALQQAAQHLAGPGAHVERQGNGVVDHDLRRQVALALARPAGLGQDPPHLVGRERLGDHAQADTVAEPNAGGQAGRGTGHCCHSSITSAPAWASYIAM